MEKSYKEIQTEIENLKKEAAAALKREAKDAISEVRQIIRKFNLTPSDCGFSAKAASKKPKTAKVKAIGAFAYRHPSDANLGWSGHGRAPNWLLELEAKGRKRAEFKV